MQQQTVQDFTDITNATLGASPIVLAVPAGVSPAIYNGTLTVRNSSTGCVSSTYPITITVNPRPVPTISGDPRACINSSGHIYTTEAGMSGYNWTISGGTINSGSGTNTVSVTWNTAGDRTISVNYTNTNGCTARAPTIY